MKSIAAYKIDDKSPQAKKSRIKEMFNSIAPSYDSLNSFLSFGIDGRWRRKLSKLCGDSSDSPILDLCCGTGDLSRELLNRGHEVVSLDFSIGMLSKGVQSKSLGKSNIAADASMLPFGDSVFDLAVVSFGIRNIPDMTVFCGNVFRVLRPGGRLLILELTRPRNFIVRLFYNIYLKRILPFIGGLVSGRHDAYAYLSKTIATFLDSEELKKIMLSTGFERVEYEELTFGVATIYVCEKS